MKRERYHAYNNPRPFRKYVLNLHTARLGDLETERKRAEDSLASARSRLASTQERAKKRQELAEMQGAIRKQIAEAVKLVTGLDKRSFLAHMVGIPPSSEVVRLRNRINELLEEEAVYINQLKLYLVDYAQSIQRDSDQIKEAEIYLAKVDYFIRRKKDEEDAWIDLRNRAAQNSTQTRDTAQIIKDRIKAQHCCPYCGGNLGDTPHADHIYPVSKGGRSTERNMVYVCARCNEDKSDLTLSAFIRHYNLDRDAIEERLRQLGKDF